MELDTDNRRMRQEAADRVGDCADPNNKIVYKAQEGDKKKIEKDEK